MCKRVHLQHCSTCSNFQAKKSAKPLALPSAKSFNQTLEMDTFHIRWGESNVVFGPSLIDACSRSEMKRIIEAESEKKELQVLSAWRASSEQFLSYMDERHRATTDLQFAVSSAPGIHPNTRKKFWKFSSAFAQQGFTKGVTVVGLLAADKQGLML